MGANLGHETDALNFLADLAREPYKYDFYQTLRRLECLYDNKPRWGTALRPVDEPVRLGQDPDVAFAPSPLASLARGSVPGRWAGKRFVRRRRVESLPLPTTKGGARCTSAEAFSR